MAVQIEFVPTPCAHPLLEEGIDLWNDVGIPADARRECPTLEQGNQVEGVGLVLGVRRVPREAGYGKLSSGVGQRRPRLHAELLPLADIQQGVCVEFGVPLVDERLG